MKKCIAILLLAAAGFAVFIGSPLFPKTAAAPGAWQVVRYTMGAGGLDGADIFAADADGDGRITLSDAVRHALREN